MTARQKIKSFFKSRKANVFILFLLLSLLFSILTKLSRDYTQTIIFDINVESHSDEEIIINDSISQLQITMTTFGFKFIQYYFSKPSLRINTAELDRTESSYIWTRSKGLSNLVSQFDSDVKIEAVIPDSLVFRFDNNDSKKVPIVLNSNINFSSGYNIVGQLILKPDSLKIIGPEIMLDTINFVTTDSLILSDVNKNIETMVTIPIPKNKSQLKISHDKVSVSAKIEKFTEGSVEVPILIKNLPDDLEIKYYPKTISVVFYTSLSNVDNISISSFIIVCDYDQRMQDASYLVPKITQQPDGVKNVRLDVNKVEYIIVQ